MTTSSVTKITNKVGLSNVFGGNFGDLIGPYLYQAIAQAEPIIVSVNMVEERDAINFEHYLVVGSILKHVTKHSQIWGIGIMNLDDPKLIQDKLTTENVYAVRGPKTLWSLIEIGLIEYSKAVALGDPALLLPLIYNPKVSHRRKLGLIPHHTEFDSVQKRFQNMEDISVIQLGGLGGYRNIESVLDQICSCDKIASSSLHGIIAAHAYSIPAAWCHFTKTTEQGKLGTGPLKYLDYFESVNIDCKSATSALSNNLDLPENSFVLPSMAQIEALQIQLLQACPFNVRSFTSSDLKFGT